MAYKRNLNDKPIEGNPKFVPIIKWYEVMQDLEMRLIEYLETHNIDGILTIYQLYYLKWKPYLTQFFKNDPTLKTFLDFNDVYEMQSNFRVGMTEYDQRKNSQLSIEIERNIMQKWSKLKQLIAKSNMEIPIEKKEWRPAALDGDDW